MEILKGKVQDPGFPDTEITYLKADDGKTYFFIENGTLKNGNFIATPILKEGIGHAPYTSLGLLSPNGEVLIPFENKNIQVLSNDLLLVERNTPVTDSVKDALTKQNDPTSSAELEANAKTIKDQINSVMGMNGSYVFDNQFSEAALYTTTGTNLANNYFSFIGSKEGAYYMSSNVVGSPISKYDPYAFAMDQEESDETQQEADTAVENNDVQNNEVPQENAETSETENNPVPDINIPAVDNNTAPTAPEGTSAVDIANPAGQTVDTTPLNFDSNLLNNQEPLIPEVNPEEPATETQAEEPAAVPGLDIPLFNQNIEESQDSSLENNQVEETSEQPTETVEENTSNIEEEQPTAEESAEDNSEEESSEIPSTDIFNEHETNAEEENSEEIENTEETESEETEEVSEENESEESEEGSNDEETSTEDEAESTEEEEETSVEENDSETEVTTDIFNEKQESEDEEENSEEIEDTEETESEETEEVSEENESEEPEEESSDEETSPEADSETDDDSEEESTEDDSTGGTYKEEKEEDIEEQINNPVIANATSTIKKLLEENRKQRQLVDQQEGEIESLNSTNDILKEDNSSKTKEIISLRNNLSKYRKDNGELLRENNHLKSVVSRQDDLIEHLKNQNSMLKEQVAGITALGNIVAEANTVFNDGVEETSYEDNNLEYGYLDSDEESYQYSKKSQ